MAFNEADILALTEALPRLKERQDLSEGERNFLQLFEQMQKKAEAEAV